MEIIHTHQAREFNLHSKLPSNIIVFSHLRWDFVYQRPQHLLSRFSRRFNIFFVEEPVFGATDLPYYSFVPRDGNVVVVTPHLKEGIPGERVEQELKSLFNEFMLNKQLSDSIFWYYTPMALEFSRKYIPELVIYDCMDELSAFKFAPEKIKQLEQELLKTSDVVFTGGQSLFEAKKVQHANIYPFPSSIEKNHFAKARLISTCPADQIRTGKPKLGFYGVIDERFDIDLIRAIADQRPEWQIILIGPIVKIDQNTLPRNTNIHYLGSKNYQELPLYMADWDIALIPFLLNESTRFISPTKTPEYLAAGLPVISTAIKDIVNPYGNRKLVHICHTSTDFIKAAEEQLAMSVADRKKWLGNVDQFLALNSWDKTYEAMFTIIDEAVINKVHVAVAL